MQLAKMVGEVARGDREEEAGTQTDPAAVERGKARSDVLSPRKPHGHRKKAAKARWKRLRGS